MSKFQPIKDNKPQAEGARTEPENDLGADRRYKRSRRRVLQSLAAGGAAVTVKALPEKWAKPVLETSVIPVHAHASIASSLTCEIDRPALDGDYNESPARQPGGPWLVGGQTGTIDNLDPTPQVGSGALFEFNSLAATVAPPLYPLR